MMGILWYLVYISGLLLSCGFYHVGVFVHACISPPSAMALTGGVWLVTPSSFSHILQFGSGDCYNCKAMYKVLALQYFFCLLLSLFCTVLLHVM